MGKLARRASLSFSGGCVGGLANSIAVWGFGALGITAGLGVQIAPDFSPPWLYPRVVWGGLWGLLFLVPLLNSRLFAKGVLLSLAPSLVQWFVVFPLKAHKGVMGLELGLLTPAFVILFNIVWGIAAAGWLRLCAGHGSGSEAA